MTTAETGTEWTKLYSGPNAEVWIHERCLQELELLNPKDRSKIETCMEDMYCAMEDPSVIPVERLNRNEGWHRGLDGKEYRVQAFKHHQGRVYGVQGSVLNKRTFFATCAATKKQDRADQRELKRAATRVENLIESIRGARL